MKLAIKSCFCNLGRIFKHLSHSKSSVSGAWLSYFRQQDVPVLANKEHQFCLSMKLSYEDVRSTKTNVMKNIRYCSQAMETNESLQFGVFRTQNMME